MLFFNNTDNNIVEIQPPFEENSVRCKNSIKIFLAGGITNCPNWQKVFISTLKLRAGSFLEEKNITIYNPRRDKFDLSDKSIAEEQICWEHTHLSEADIIVMWFSKGSINPITLYELGRYITGPQKFESVIGVDPEYERGYDVNIQVKLELGTDFKINQSLEDMVDDLIDLILDIDENSSC
jgi:hypothetical protein